MATKKRCPKGISKTTGKCLQHKRPSKAGARKSTARKAATKRGNCKKFGRFASGPKKGMCRKGPATKRGNCKKFGRFESGPKKGMCRKGPATSKGARQKKAVAKWGEDWGASSWDSRAARPMDLWAGEGR